MKRGAIFDMDGTLIDTEKIYRKAWIETADSFGVERKPDLAAAMSGSGLAQMPSIVKKFFPDLDAEEYVKRTLDKVVKEAEQHIDVKPGVENILNYFLSEKIPMAIASSSESFVVEERVKRFGWEKYFSVLIGGDKISNGKPAPDIFLLAAEKLQLPAKDCYVFEDSFNGVRAGAAANCATIMVIDCVEPTEELRKLCAGVYDDMNSALEDIRLRKI